MPFKNASMSKSKHDDELSRRWRTESANYVSAVNAFVARGEREGWDKLSGEVEPTDTRETLAEAVLAAVRRANECQDIAGLRERFPPAHGPFIEMLEENGQSLPVVLLLDDGRIVTRVGAPYEPGKVVVINDLTVETLPDDIITVGRSPNRRYFAVAHRSGIAIHDGWNGPVTARLKWPTGLEGIPKGFQAQRIEEPPIVTRIIPFDSGEDALLVSPVGVFVIKSDRARRLLPTEEQMRRFFEYLLSQHPGEPLTYGLSMEHGAISPDGTLIAAGHQSSSHYVFRTDSCDVIGDIGHRSEYPCCAAFSSDGRWIAFNSCHFYNGRTIGVRTELLPGLKTEPYKDDDRIVLLEDGSRVYAAVYRNDEFIIGNANGYLRAFDVTGQARWEHFIGSSIGDIDVSPDGQQLIVTTYAGFLCILDMDTGEADPFSIGTSDHKERRRWLFWKKEPQPLVW
jgi:hypothetical protein